MLEDHPRTCFSDDRINPRSWGLRITPLKWDHPPSGEPGAGKLARELAGISWGMIVGAGFWYMIPC